MASTAFFIPPQPPQSPPTKYRESPHVAAPSPTSLVPPSYPPPTSAPPQAHLQQFVAAQMQERGYAPEDFTRSGYQPMPMQYSAPVYAVVVPNQVPRQGEGENPFGYKRNPLAPELPDFEPQQPFMFAASRAAPVTSVNGYPAYNDPAGYGAYGPVQGGPPAPYYSQAPSQGQPQGYGPPPFASNIYEQQNPNYVNPPQSVGFPQQYAQTQQYGQPQQPQQYGQPQQPPQYGQPQQSPQYGQPQQSPQYGQHQQSPQFGQPQQYDQPQSYGQPDSYGTQRYGQQSIPEDYMQHRPHASGGPQQDWAVEPYNQQYPQTGNTQNGPHQDNSQPWMADQFNSNGSQWADGLQTKEGEPRVTVTWDSAPREQRAPQIASRPPGKVLYKKQTKTPCC